MPLFGLLTYFFLLYIRPADWVPVVLNWPLEAVTIAGTLAAGMVFSSRKRRGTLPPHVPLLLAWVVCILLSNIVHGNLWKARTEAAVYSSGPSWA
jgi:hypothetical protein